MKRREFMVAASGVSGGAVAATAATPVVAQEDENGDDTETNDDGENGNGDDVNGDEENGDDENGNGNGAANGNGGGGTETVLVDDNFFEPEELTIEPGTTVRWEWVGEAEHNVNPDDDQPEGADWEGHPELITDGEYEHTFEVEGTYDYVCDPHIGVGMVGTIEVTEDADEQAAVADVDIDELGIPIQKHFVGIASFLAIFVSFVFTFYLLKYGESAHTSSPGRD